MKNVAVVQLTSTEDIDQNLAAIERHVREAADAGAEVVALPENATFLRIEPTARAPVEGLDGPTIGRLRSLAGETRTWLLVGSFPERSAGGGRFHNTSVVIDGTRPEAPVTASYRKIHLFDVDLPSGESHRESDTIAPGDRPIVTDIAGVPTGLSICYDLRFPLLYQRLVELGARLLTVPAAFTEFTGKDHWLPLLRARAIETQTWVVAPGQSGHHGGKRRSYGKSCVIDPWGVPVAVCPDGPGWVMARIDLEHQDRIRRSLPCLQHRVTTL